MDATKNNGAERPPKISRAVFVVYFFVVFIISMPASNWVHCPSEVWEFTTMLPTAMASLFRRQVFRDCF